MQLLLPHYLWNTLGSSLHLELKCAKKGPTGYPGPSRPSSPSSVPADTGTAAPMRDEQ